LGLRLATIGVAMAIQELLAQHATTTVVVVGHEQGGAIALRLAEAGLADVAVAVGATLPSQLHPERPSQARIVMIQGANGEVWTAPTFEAFKAAGFPALSTTVAGA